MKTSTLSRLALAAVAWLALGAAPASADKAQKKQQAKQQEKARQQTTARQNERRAMQMKAQMMRQNAPNKRAQGAASKQAQAATKAEKAAKMEKTERRAKKGKAEKTERVREVQNSAPQRPQILAIAADSPPLVQNREAVAQAAAKIDALVLSRLAEAGQKPNPAASDEQFLRRVFLDAVGRIPTADEVTAFLSSKASDKRAQVIDTLLLSQGYRSQSFNYVAGMLRIKDKVNKGGPTYAYAEWLKARIAANSPWNETVSQMMTASGGLNINPATGYLLRDPGMPLDNLSNTLTTFLGANIACAQCHNHPLAPWTQRQFYEMAAFFEDVDTKVQKPNGLVKKVLKQSKELTEADKGLLTRIAAANTSMVRVVPGRTLEFPKDYSYNDAKPGSLVHPALFTWEPQDSKSPAYAATRNLASKSGEERRQAFAAWLTHPDNPRFALSIANRLWQKNFGLAVQEPVSDLDDLTKASNPALLVRLGAEMKRLNFDWREFQRVLYNTQTYQRQASATPDLGKGPYLFPGPVLRRMSAEQAWDSVLTLAVGTELDRYQLRRAQALQPLVISAKTITPDALEAKTKALKGSLPSGRKGMADGGYQTPEGAAAPLRFNDMVLARASELEQPAKESHFLRMFGQSDREVADDASREGGIPQVLMLMNGQAQNVLANRDALALKTALQLPTPAAQVESLYLSFLGRRPSNAEKSQVLRALGQGMTMPEFTWVLFNTREFIFVQ